jgi:chemotaxis protein CheY-P-specific phosphatase CheC
MAVNNKIVSTDDILLKLCNSVSSVLTKASHSQINHAAMVQKIKKTSLKPDIGCFVIFDGGFSGLVIINFSAQSALEIYRGYLLNMGIPESELANSHTSDEVSNVMGELMNQILGKFISTISQELQTSITQSQPKMLTINKQLVISIEANLDEPVSRRVSFKTAQGHVFYLELSIDDTQFLQLKEFETAETSDPDEILEQHQASQKEPSPEVKVDSDLASDNDDLLAQLGI